MSRAETYVPQLETKDQKALARDLGRSQADTDARFRKLPFEYLERWRSKGGAVTGASGRTTLKFEECTVVNAKEDLVQLYLPTATPGDAGRRCVFIKQWAAFGVDLIPQAGSLINSFERWEGVTEVGLHEVWWDGVGWWLKEPTAKVRTHKLTPDTLGLWQFANKSMADSSPGARTLTVAAGTERYNYISGTLGGFHFNGDTVLIYNTADAALRLTGDMTALFLWVNQQLINNAFWFSHAGASASETAPNNYLYALRNVTAPDIGWLQESGAGVDATATLVNSSPLGHHVYHVAVTRTSGVVQLYINGRPFGTASGALTTPTDGSSGRLRIGGDDTTFVRGVMTSFQLLSRSLSAQEVMDARNYTLGGAQGYIIA